MSVTNYCRTIVCVLLVFFLSACGLPKAQQSTIKTYLFTLPKAHSSTTLGNTQQPTIVINHISSLPPFNSTFFIFKLAKANYQKDYYHRFLAMPTEQIHQIAMSELADSGNFSKTFTQDSGQAANYEVDFTLRELYIDTTHANQPAAIISIEALVSKISMAGNKVLLFEKTYRQVAPITNYSAGAQQIVMAWDQGLAAVFRKFNTDCANALSQNTKALS